MAPGSASRVRTAVLLRSRFEARRPWLIGIAPVFSDVLLALLVREAASVVRGVRAIRVGRFLPKSSPDELPRLRNVLRDEMGLVGPRPRLPRGSEEIGVTQSKMLRVRPGITGPWRVGGRGRTSSGEGVRIDACHARNWSAWPGLVTFARADRTPVLDRGAH